MATSRYCSSGKREQAIMRTHAVNFIRIIATAKARVPVQAKYRSHIHGWTKHQIYWYAFPIPPAKQTYTCWYQVLVPAWYQVPGIIPE